MDRDAMTGAAFIALGANLPHGSGSPADTLTRALDTLQQLSVTPLRCSTFYRSDPRDCPPGSPEYLNAVALLQPLPGVDAVSLLHSLQAIELAEGRVRTGLRNEARTLDLDLLAFGDTHCATPELTLPHPRAHERRFVLEPWCELAGPGWPLAGSTLGAWLARNQDPPLRRL